MKYLSFLLKLSLISMLLGAAFQPVFAKDSNQGQRPEKNAKVCAKGTAGTMACHSRVIVDAQGQPNATVLPAGMSPAQLRSAYNVANISLSANRTIAIVDAYDDPNIFSDLTKYSQTFNIQPTISQCPASSGTAAVPCFQKVNQRGTSTPPSANASWSLEIALDVESAHAMCPQCSILLVEADSPSIANLMAAIDRAVTMGAKIVSNSYGGSEFSGETAQDSHFNKPGVAFTFSSGDSGYGAEYPAASPYITAVGGTTLNMSGLTRTSETAWSAAGSGCSVYEPLTSSQTSDSVCAHRKITDVSADADPATGAAVYDTVRYQGKSGWFKVGGTSLAAPLIAAVYALAGPAGYSAVAANSLPYSHTANLNDVISGSNGSCGATYLCTAGTGYDGPTGLGAPNGTGAF